MPVMWRTVAAWSNWAVLPCALTRFWPTMSVDLRVGHVGEVLASQGLARAEGHEMHVVLRG